MPSLALLSRAHDREGFDCGSDALNAYPRHTARQHTERGISRTFVLVEAAAPEPKPVLGYFALNLCQLTAVELPPELARKLPRETAGLKLGRLVVAKDRQRQGLGQRLLVAAMAKAVEVHGAAGGFGLFVDAQDVAAREWYERFGFVPLATIEEALRGA